MKKKKKELHGLNATHVSAEQVTYWGRSVDSCPMQSNHPANNGETAVAATNPLCFGVYRGCRVDVLQS